MSFHLKFRLGILKLYLCVESCTVNTNVHILNTILSCVFELARKVYTIFIKIYKNTTYELDIINGAKNCTLLTVGVLAENCTQTKKKGIILRINKG